MPQPNFLKRSFKRFLLLCLFLAALLGGAALWLLSSEREITGLSELIIARLQPEEAPFELRVQRVALDWQSWREPAHIKLEGIEILSAAYDASVQIASGGVNLKMLPLLWGKLEIDELELTELAGEVHLGSESLYIVNREGKLFYRHYFDESTQINRDEDALLTFPIDGLKLQFDVLLLKDLERSLSVPLSAVQLSLHRRAQDRLDLQANATFEESGEKQAGQLALSGDYQPHTRSGDVQLVFERVNPLPICRKIELCAQLPALDMPLSGGVQLQLESGMPSKVTVALSSQEKGTLTYQPHLPEVIGLDSLLVKAQLDVQERRLMLPELRLGIDTATRIEASGSARYDDAGLTLDAKARAEMMPVNHLERYWPSGLAPQTRLWATTKIRGGMATEAETTITLRPDDLQAELLPDGFLSARIEVEDSSVDYLAGFEKAQEARATVYFTGTTMTADVHRAKAYSGTIIENSKLVMTDMNADGTPMTAALNVKTNPSDVAKILAKLPNPNLHAAAERLRGASGELGGTLNLAFNAFGDSAGGGEINWDALRYDVQAQLANLRGVALHPALVMQSLSGQLAASDDKLSATLNAADALANYSASISSSGAAPMSFSVQATSKDNPAQKLQSIKGTYERGEMPSLSLTGERLDLSAFLEKQPQSERSGLRLSALPPFHLKLDIGELVMDGGQALQALKGYVQCPSLCESAYVAARIGDGSVLFKIFREAGQRRLQLTSDRLGDVLRLTDAKGKVFGGALDLQGRYADDLAGHPLIGRLIMTDFFLRDAPIMGRILNAGSLVGLVDALKGDGIRFDKFAADFRLADDIIQLKDGKAAGPAMGVLIEGDINLATNMLDVSGNLAPAYVLNSLIGKVPLIGDLLVGGEGESVFAINYAARGDMDDPSITVNPLSALTPGFTRRFFDVFDDGERDTRAPEDSAPPPDAAPAQAEPPLPSDAGGISSSQWQVINP